MVDEGTRNGDTLTSTAGVEAEVPSPSKAAPPRKNKYRRSAAVLCFGVDLTPDNIAVAMVYFVQGVLGLSRLAVSFYLKDDLHLDPAEVCKLCICSSSVDCYKSFCFCFTILPYGWTQINFA